jgi:hypothetical protein
MSVRCEECNYENLPQHTFCGMCGAKLSSRRRVDRERAEAQAFSRPSLLGLAAEDQPTETGRVDYLLEDEPSGGHSVRWIAVLVLVAAAAAGWHWRAEVRGWTLRAAKASDATPAADARAVPAATATAQPTTVPPDPAVATVPNPQPAQQVSAGDNGTQNATATPPASGPSDQAAMQPNAAVTNAVKQEPEPQEAEVQVPEASPPAEKPTLKPAATKMEYKTAAKNVAADALEAQGEDYLYGRGVPADCGRAGKSLLAAAQSSVKAQSVLGTMYATGHCVTRDVPVAYRWFAKASHQDPANIRLQRDLEVLWAQMTPEEREVAIKTER